MPFPTTQQVNLPACSPHCPCNAVRQAGKLWIPILKLLVKSNSESNPSLQPQRPTHPLSARPSSCLVLCQSLCIGQCNIIHCWWSISKPYAHTTHNHVNVVCSVLRHENMTRSGIKLGLSNQRSELELVELCILCRTRTRSQEKLIE